MKHPSRCALAFTITLAAALPGKAQFLKQTNLVSDVSGMATITDPSLVNPWGVSLSGNSPFWVSDAGTRVATLYSVDPTTGAVAKVGLTVNIPAPAPAGPSGQVFNGSGDFVVSSGGASGPARFIFAGLDGKIYGWNPGVPPQPPNTTSTQAVLAANGVPPAAYTGIALGVRASGQHLYAANPAGGRVDVYDKNFAPVSLGAGAFADPTPLPAGDAPFNVANINGNLYVSYTGPTGVINVFSTDGVFIRRFATDGTLLNPWGMVVAPADFGHFSNALLVGNFNAGNAANGPGYIGAYDLTTRTFLGLVKGTDGNSLTIDGLWQLIFGNGVSGGNSGVLYFAAGIQNQQHGLFGSLSTCHGPAISGVSATPNVIWPPNNKFVPVAINYSVADDCDAAPVCTLSVTNDETGSADATVVNAHAVELLATRLGKGNGRVYTIDISCHDKLPLSSSASTTVTVPHDQGH